MKKYATSGSLNTTQIIKAQEYSERLVCVRPNGKINFLQGSSSWPLRRAKPSDVLKALQKQYYEMCCISAQVCAMPWISLLLKGRGEMGCGSISFFMANIFKKAQVCSPAHKAQAWGR